MTPWPSWLSIALLLISVGALSVVRIFSSEKLVCFNTNQMIIYKLPMFDPIFSPIKRLLCVCISLLIIYQFTCPFKSSIALSYERSSSDSDSASLEVSTTWSTTTIFSGGGGGGAGGGDFNTILEGCGVDLAIGGPGVEGVLTESELRFLFGLA